MFENNNTKQTLDFFSTLSINIISNNDLKKRQLATRLNKNYFYEIALFSYENVFSKISFFENSKLLILDIGSAENEEIAFTLLQLAKSRASSMHVVFIDKKFSTQQIVKGARLGASDFWLMGPYFNIEELVQGLFLRKQTNPNIKPFEEKFETSLFKTAGLTSAEIGLLAEFSKGFFKQSDIALLLNKRRTNINKLFSRIYDKLKFTLNVDNPAKLASLLTVCQFFREI